MYLVCSLVCLGVVLLFVWVVKVVMVVRVGIRNFMVWFWWGVIDGCEVYVVMCWYVFLEVWVMLL